MPGAAVAEDPGFVPEGRRGFRSLIPKEDHFSLPQSEFKYFIFVIRIFQVKILTLTGRALVHR
jgi:hypothetical protein